jgi:hypothetical protein
MKSKTIKLIRNRNVPLPGDVYIKRLAVYRVVMYDETNDTTLFATTNDIITIYGQIPRLEIRKNDFYPCPYQLLGPAIQVFELDEKYSEKSLVNLQDYRLQHVKTYERIGLPELFEDIEDARTRVYTVPDEQGEQFPGLKGKSFQVLVPFMCISKGTYKERYQTLDLPADKGYFKAMRYTAWPIFYVPSRFE